MAMLEVEIWRGERRGRRRGSSYAVPHEANQTVLDVVTHVQRYLDPSLAYRFACRVGHVRLLRDVRKRPPALDLPHPCLAGRAQGPAAHRAAAGTCRSSGTSRSIWRPFFEKWRDAEARFVPPPAPVDEAVRPDEPERMAADAGIECINCAVCYAACDSVAWNPDYPGPAVLNRLWTLVNDRRDGDRDGHSGRGRGGLPPLPQPPGMRRCLPHGPQPDGGDRGPEAGDPAPHARTPGARARAMKEAWLFAAQRLSALVMAPLVLLHLGIILYAVRGGLSAEEILSRTEGSLFWGATYGLFVLAAAVHAPIGLRAVLREWGRWRGAGLDIAMTLFGLVLLVLGLRAMAAVL